MKLASLIGAIQSLPLPPSPLIYPPPDLKRGLAPDIYILIKMSPSI